MRDLRAEYAQRGTLQRIVTAIPGGYSLAGPVADQADYLCSSVADLLENRKQVRAKRLIGFSDSLFYHPRVDRSIYLRDETGSLDVTYWADVALFGNLFGGPQRQHLDGLGGGKKLCDVVLQKRDDLFVLLGFEIPHSTGGKRDKDRELVWSPDFAPVLVRF